MDVLKILLLILALLLAVLGVLRTRKYLAYRRRRRRAGKAVRPLDGMTWLCYGLVAIVLLCALVLPTGQSAADPQDTTAAADTTQATTAATPAVTPHKTAATDPANWGITWEVYQNGQLLTDYTRPMPISFGDGADYFALPGIATFRGSNYRNTAAYGTADLTDCTLSTAWEYRTGTLSGSTWSGSGWTGQPLIVQWPESTRKAMNLYPDKQAKDGLVEVIYATLDGSIYFLDLADGAPTRDPITLGQCFKGAGALDPRGYPILYVGSGDVSPDGRKPRAYAISLIDGSVLYSFGENDPLSLRTDNDCWSAFDSSPLVDAQTDTLIWPGENGLLYTVRLNTVFDGTAVTLTPDAPVIARYRTARSSADSCWYGYEPSAVVSDGYLYISENGGMFFCVDLNTMQLVWAQDTKDDSNCTPAYQPDGTGGGSLYTAPSLHWTQSEDATGTISIYKLDALTGEILWETPYQVHTVSGVSGGVQSSPLLGQAGTTLDGLVVYTISRTPQVGTGLLVALDTDTGREVWRMEMDYYAWSSPVAVYDSNGTGYILVCDSNGTAFFLEGSSGTVRSTLSLGGLVEASPAVYGSTAVIGTRNEKILGITLG